MRLGAGNLGLPPGISGRGAPAGGGTDPHFASVTFLNGFEGADGSAVFVDESTNNTKTVNHVDGNAQIDTADARFGSSSLLLDGSGDGIEWDTDADWNMPDEFTIEAFCKLNSTSFAVRGLANQWSNLNGTSSWRIGYNKATATLGRPIFEITTDGNPANVTNITSTGDNDTFADQDWMHIAVDRDASDVIRCYLNGVMINSATVAGFFNASTKRMSIGSWQTANSPSSHQSVWTGWIDDFRITKGVARYATDTSFVVPTAAFPRSA